MCAFYLAFCTSKKQAVRPDGTGHPLPLTAHLLKRQGAAQLHKKSHYPGRDRASCAARGTLIKKARCCAAAQKEPQRGADSPASLVRQSGRALCSGVLRHSPGRAGGACLGKKQVGAGTDMRVFSAQPKAGTLPGVP